MRLFVGTCLICLFGIVLLLIFTGYVGNEWLLCEYSTK